ncbi:MAG: DUF2071 domain-containing protein, partial [Bacteroidota bacterium]
MPKPVFLRAEWRKLVMANYEVDPNILATYIPFGTEIDTWNDRCYVSLVGFMFLNTRVLGFPIPFHRNFEEFNLRFYVRYKEDGEWKRGVVFIKELVPKAAITFVANTLYQEHYQTVPMRHDWGSVGETQQVRYEWKFKGKWDSIWVEAEKEGKSLVEGSEAQFITEHYWGYTKINETTTYEYQVEHPSWEIYPVLNHEIKIDVAALYGAKFLESLSKEPLSVFLAEGSE